MFSRESLKNAVRLFAYLWPHRGTVAVLCILTVLGVGLGLVSPWLTKVLIDDALLPRDTRMLRLVVLAMLGAGLLRLVVGYASGYLSQMVGHRIIRRMRNQLFEHLQGLTLRFYERHHIGVVLQEPFLFGVSIRENIAYGRPGASDDEIRAAALEAEAHDFVSGLPDGYDTVVGERGMTLSVGQKQRISIARALLKDPEILVLDEATSAVDTMTEKAIQRALEAAARDRTAILIAHRLSTTFFADRILVLDEGRIVEQGGAEDLLAQGGLFARLYNMQVLEGRLGE